MAKEKVNILYVDDEDVNLLLFKHALKKEYEFILTDSPLEVLPILEENEIKILITDQRMPDMTGLQLIKEVNKKYPDIICVILTAFVDAEIILAAINKGEVYRYVTKPWRKEEMKSIIKNAIRTYDLKAENKKLIDELVNTNIELERHKSHLESIVSEQTKEINGKNKILNQLVATKDKFFSIIAHDLKNHFSVVKNSSELLLLDFKSLTNEKRKKITELMNKETKNTYNLLENLLLWSKTQTGNFKLMPEKIKLIELVDEVNTLFSEIAKKKEISIINKIDDNVFIFADLNSINTVLRNLISNAIKFTNKGGVVKIESKSFIDDNEDKKVQVFIIDDGVGISKENLDKIFKIDSNYTTDGTENEKGTGLGLILCKEFINKNNGKIFVESEIGKGTIFSFTLKCA